MKSLIFDIETDGIEATKLWCLSILDTSNQEQHSYGPSELQEGLSALMEADTLIGHNIIGYDIPVIKNLTSIDLNDKKIVDTLVLSRLFNPVREGGHGLERWGYILKSHKINFNDYSKFTLNMLKYCEQDVLLNYKVYERLKQEAAGFSRQSVEIEHAVAKIMNEQRNYGFLFNIEEAMKLVATLNERMSKIQREIRKVFLPAKEVLKIFPRYNKFKKLLKTGKTNYGKNVRLTEKEFNLVEQQTFITRVIETEFNPGSRKQIGERLQDLGWKPKEFTPTGQAKIDEKILSSIKKIKEAKILAEFLMLQKRIAQVDSWLSDVEDDNRVRGFVNHNGTITGRMTHRNPNLAQTPSVYSKYGKECRSCWIVKPNYKLVGIDASGLELRMLAHYMKDEEYINEIINGDIHSTNQRLAGLESRNQAKTFIYALLYGAGDLRLGEILGGTKRTGANIRKSFINNLPSFNDLKTRVGREARKGFIKALDGRKLIIRSEHSALNTLLQGAGSIVMKKALILLDEKLKDIDAHFVANVHDEWQIEVKEDMSDTVGKLGVECIIEAGKLLKLRCPLDGEYKVGSNWSETH